MVVAAVISCLSRRRDISVLVENCLQSFSAWSLRSYRTKEKDFLPRRRDTSALAFRHVKPRTLHRCSDIQCRIYFKTAHIPFVRSVCVLFSRHCEFHAVLANKIQGKGDVIFTNRVISPDAAMRLFLIHIYTHTHTRAYTHIHAQNFLSF